ncbi:hypothetical protein Kpol_1023p97 [Vanderwaltozyma polyspora DSM 70294]|uniref:BZIP domain-containing protein n=1 Tax=Vanderwaltozyma polyspora (strain ATCC 22028 / DSM 70294 / BCRC 21397 / CBS 2163 / NBRC 10782 / NRRL Y-8283 / UCD 57-17) TaxID=436907 RepID=A7TFW6_VANPO|nr:uncharacterized protein Kpol_1023p97 [Vanderwaltozyma polyspora DSM 70294]EDO18924.1 hypothetical protein Kpol_1023p97 [Vanderwaltozyma polyspora DSM 70294]
MTSVTVKRPLDESLTALSPNDNNSSILNASTDVDASTVANANKKKVGRKLLGDHEVKNKRTAQNRAAQRAFRERKERKMKELEDKVHELEKVKQQNDVESEFLRNQLTLMIDELKKYRPEKSSDIKVLEYLAKHEENGSTEKIKKNIQRKEDFSFEYPPPPPHSQTQGSSADTNVTYNKQNTDQRLPSPGSSSGSSPNMLMLNNKKQSILNNRITTPSSSTSSSSGWMDNVFYKDDAQNLPHFDTSSTSTNTAFRDSPVNNSINSIKLEDNLKNNNNSALTVGYDSDLFSNDFNFDDHFDQQVSSFCVKMNQACGTKQNPVPKTMAESNKSQKTPPSEGNPSTTPNESSNDSSLSIAKFDDPNFLFDSPSNDFTNTLDIPSVDSSNANSNFGQLGFHGLSNDITFNSNDSNWNDFISLKTDSMTSVPTTSSVATNDHPINISKPSEENSPRKEVLPFIDTSIAFPETKADFDAFDNQMFFRDDGFNESLNISDDIVGAESDDEQDNNNDNDLISKNLVCEEVKEHDMVIPTSDGKLLKCSEVWDRITAHPRYSDIDIDGLCQELMHNAKCSDKGVVVDSKDVQKALSNHMS